MHKFVGVLEKYDQMMLEKGHKDILESWKEQATKLKCKLSEFYKTFMPQSLCPISLIGRRVTQ